MKKIVIVSDAWFPQVNGVITSIEKTIKLLKERGFEAEVIHPGLFHTVPLFFYPEIRIPIFPRRKIKRLLLSYKPDYIHIATEGMLGFVTRSVCKKYKLQFTTAYHTHFSHYTKLRVGVFFNLIYSYLRWFHNSGVVTMVSTLTLKNELSSRGFENIVICPLGVDTELFTRNTFLSPRHFEKPIFVYFGRIAIEKGVEEFLKCNLPGTKLVIGNGPQRKELEKIYGSKAVFVDYKKGQALVDWLSVSDVFVFPSRTETFGLVVLEALACGVPVAAHNVMGPKDIITEGVDGFLDEDLERAAKACLALSREDCRKKALTFSWAASCDAFEKNLHRV